MPALVRPDKDLNLSDADANALRHCLAMLLCLLTVVTLEKQGIMLVNLPWKQILVPFISSR